MFDKKLVEKVIVAVIAICAVPAHEFGHWLGFRLSGIPAVFYYNNTEPLSSADNIWGVAGGPLLSLGLALLGLAMMHLNRRNKELWSYFSVVMCLTRLVPYMFFLVIPDGFLLNDEGMAANILGLHIWSVYMTFLIAFLAILSFIFYTYRGESHKLLGKYRWGYILYVTALIAFGLHIT